MQTHAPILMASPTSTHLYVLIVLPNLKKKREMLEPVPFALIFEEREVILETVSRIADREGPIGFPVLVSSQ